MIQIYKAGTEEFEKNGDMTLMPESCETECELNGNWEMELSHPIDSEGRWKYIQEGAVIAAPLFRSEKQLFRIYRKKKNHLNVAAYARPIANDAAKEVFLTEMSVSGNGQEVLDAMLKGQSKYKATSDITKRATASYTRKNFVEATQGDNEESFLNIWGGEVQYDNFTIIINERIGRDNGARAEFGYNSTEIEEDVDMTDVVTRIIPVAYNDYMLDGEEPWVDSPLIDQYPIIYKKTMEFRDVKLKEDASEGEEGFETLKSLQEELKRKCKEQFDNGVDKPACSYTCDMVSLENTEEYKYVKGLEKIGIGDTVHCKNRKLGIITDARAIKITYDNIRKKNSKVELGDYKYNYITEMASVAQRVDSAIRQDGSLIGEQVKGTIDAMKANLHAQSTAAKRTKAVAYLIEVLDMASELYGAMEAGTQGLRVAKEKLPDGSWDWRTAVTAAGIIADLIVAGRLADRKGNNYFDLDEGILSAKDMRVGPFQVTEDGIYYWTDENGTEQSSSYWHAVLGPEGQTGETAMAVDEINFKRVGSKSTKSGRAEFSDGSYMEFKNGVLVGGSTTEGGAID